MDAVFGSGPRRSVSSGRGVASNQLGIATLNPLQGVVFVRVAWLTRSHVMQECHRVWGRGWCERQRCVGKTRMASPAELREVTALSDRLCGCDASLPPPPAPLCAAGACVQRSRPTRCCVRRSDRRTSSVNGPLGSTYCAVLLCDALLPRGGYCVLGGLSPRRSL